MIELRNIRSLTDFQRHTKAHLKRLKSDGLPEALTVNGKTQLIVQDAAAYEEMIDAIRGIQRGLNEAAAGEGSPAREVLQRLRARHKISRSKK